MCLKDKEVSEDKSEKSEQNILCENDDAHCGCNAFANNSDILLALLQNAYI